MDDIESAAVKFLTPSRVPWSAIVVGVSIIYLLARVLPRLISWRP